MGIGPLGYYITLRQNTVAQYITMRPIYDIEVEEKSITVPLALMPWWEHYGI